MNIQVPNIYAKSTARILETAKNIYDTKFKNDGEATLGGIFMLVVPILFSVLSYYNNSLLNDRSTIITIFIAGACVIRAVVARWIVNLSKDLNRKSFNWIVLSFFIPAITLLILGARKKIKDTNEYKKHIWVPKITVMLAPILNKIKVVVPQQA